MRSFLMKQYHRKSAVIVLMDGGQRVVFTRSRHLAVNILFDWYLLLSSNLARLTRKQSHMRWFLMKQYYSIWVVIILMGGGQQCSFYTSPPLSFLLWREVGGLVDTRRSVIIATRIDDGICRQNNAKDMRRGDSYRTFFKHEIERSNKSKIDKSTCIHFILLWVSILSNS